MQGQDAFAAGMIARARRFARTFLRRDLFPFLPATGLAAFWFGGEAVIVLVSIAVIVAWLTRPAPPRGVPRSWRQADRKGAEAILTTFLQQAERSRSLASCLVIIADDAARLTRNLGCAGFTLLMDRLAERISTQLRDGDQVVRIDFDRFAVLLAPTPRATPEGMIQIALRIQTGCATGFSLGRRQIHMALSIGICARDRGPEQRAPAYLAATESAAEEALRCGNNAIRVYSDSLAANAAAREALAADLVAAIDSGEIPALFQPVLCTDTGDISGWMIQPQWRTAEGERSAGQIMSLARTAGVEEQLDEVLQFLAFEALCTWVDTPMEAVPVLLPVCASRLARGGFASQLQWDLERLDLAPQRLVLVLGPEAVARVTEPEIARALSFCAAIGCRIEMEGFDTGAAVETIRKALIHRIRLPQRMIACVDIDPEQQRIVAAMLTMAEGLGIEAVAAGVCTRGENAMLAQLGCRHVSGPAIGAAMPLAAVADWAARHRAARLPAPAIMRREAER